MIPSWNMAGVLPPIRPGQNGASKDRSPYEVKIFDVIDSYAISPKRIEILEGLLAYRKDLYDVGLSRGFQWVNGSFMQNVELHEERAPNDVDVVTFFNLPNGVTQKDVFHKNVDLFNQDLVKKKYLVDAFLVALGSPIEKWNVQNISYWYSMWSHTRDGTWKGFLLVDLSETDDDVAKKMLNQRNFGG